jgi:DNA-binding NarL/FixJ family response regulator
MSSGVEVSPASTAPAAVGIVEDDVECASACAAELAAEGWVTRHYGSAAAALAGIATRTLEPIVLMDLGLPGEDAFAAIATIRVHAPEVLVVALTGHESDDFVFRALKAGAVGYVLKNDALGRLAEVLDQVRAGGAPMSPGIARRVIGSFRADPEGSTAQVSHLSARERDVLNMLARGFSYAECGRLLEISIDTVRTHVKSTYKKLHAATKAEAVALAIRGGWIQ